MNLSKNLLNGSLKKHKERKQPKKSAKMQVLSRNVAITKITPQLTAPSRYGTSTLIRIKNKTNFLKSHVMIKYDKLSYIKG